MPVSAAEDWVFEGWLPGAVESHWDVDLGRAVLRSYAGQIVTHAIGGAVRQQLMSMLPLMRRFAGVLANSAEEREQLLSAACEAMLENAQAHQSGTPIKHWAYSEIHAMWLNRLRERDDPIAQGPAEERLFLPLTTEMEGDREFADFLRSLPAQQRVVMLLVYGESYSYEDTAKMLDTPLETVAQRAARGLISFSAHLNGEEVAPQHEADVQMLYPKRKRAPA